MNKDERLFRWLPQGSAGILFDMREDGVTRLAGAIAQRRRELGMSVTKAAKIAAINRDTWSDAEAGRRLLHVHNRAGVERALQWADGSVDVILEGGEPAATTTALPTPYGDKLATEVDRIERLPIPAEDRLRLIRALVNLYEQQASEAK